MMHCIKVRLSRRKETFTPPAWGVRGAVLVEFAFAMLFVFFFFVAFMEFAGIFLAHEQLSFAAFAASQKYAVGKDSEAQASAYKIAGAYPSRVFKNGDATETLKGITICFRKELLDLPIDLNNIYNPSGSGSFTLLKQIDVFAELDPDNDDN